MNSLSIYLWKEWREQRAALSVLALLLALGVIAITLALQSSLLADPLVFYGIIAATVTAMLVSIGSDLLARERQRRTLTFLERAPAGLGGAFRAKLVFFVLALLASTVWGSALAVSASLLRAGELPHVVPGQGSLLLLGAALALSFWVFAVSAWTPSGATALPTALLLLPVLSWPVALVMRGTPWLRTSPTGELAFLALAVAGAPLSAWASFVLGSRRGGTRRRAALTGLVVAVLAFLPSWLWVGVRYLRVQHAPFQVLHGWVTADGQQAYLNLVRSASGSESAYDNSRPTALVVDLENGTAQFAGRIDQSTFAEERADFRRSALRGTRPPTRLKLHDADSVERIHLAEDPREPRLAPHDFGVTEEPPTFSIRWAGSGHVLRFRRKDGLAEIYRDPRTGRVIDSDTLLPGRGAAVWSDVRIRPERWLVHVDRHWQLIDPATGEMTEPVGLEKGDRVGASIADGRVLVHGEEALTLLDPDRGTRTPVEVISEEPVQVFRLTRGGIGPWEEPLPMAGPVIVLASTRTWSAPAVLDVDAATLRFGPQVDQRRVHLIGVHGLVAFAIEGRGVLARYDLESNEREVLFSVEAVDP